MSGKLDQALDDITSAQRQSARRRNNPRRSTGRQTTNAPVGGIQKNTRPARGVGAKPAPVKAAPINKDSKIIVSNLPKDVSEQQIKEEPGQLSYALASDFMDIEPFHDDEHTSISAEASDSLGG